MTPTAEAPAQTLAPRLAAALDRVSVRADGLAAAVAGRPLSADSPRDLRGRLSNALYEEFHAGNGAHRGRRTPRRAAACVTPVSKGGSPPGCRTPRRPCAAG